MLPNYDSTAPYDRNNYTIIWKEPVYDDTTTGPRRFGPSKFDFDIVKINDYSLCSNAPKSEYRKFENRHNRRKERSLKREKPRLSKRRHKHAK